MPVPHPCPIKSTETVNGVSNNAVFCPTISSSPNSSHRSSISGAQMSPRPCVAIKLIISGVTHSAAQMKSPSFSRSSSSTTMITFPFLMSSRASSIVFNMLLLINGLCLKIQIYNNKWLLYVPGLCGVVFRDEKQRWTLFRHNDTQYRSQFFFGAFQLLVNGKIAIKVFFGRCILHLLQVVVRHLLNDPEFEPQHV